MHERDEKRERNEEHATRQQRLAREKATYRYTTALERGDIETLAAVLHEAEHDGMLEQMILEVHEVYQREDGLDGVAISPVNMLPEEEPLPPLVPRRPPTRRQRVNSSIQTLVAVLLVAILLGSFIALLALHRSATQIPPLGGTHMNSLVVVGTQWDQVNGTVYAIQPVTGAILWQYTVPGQALNLMVKHENVVYVSAYDPHRNQQATISALRASDGTLLWRATPPDLNGYAYMAFDHDIVFAASNYGTTVYALNAQDGSVLWTYKTPNRNNMLITAANGVVYVFDDKGFRALQASNGKLLWTSTIQPELAIPPAMVVTNQFIYTLDETTGPAPIVVLNARNGTLIKRLPLPGSDAVMAISPQGVAYILEKTQICAVRASDGKQLWCSQKITSNDNISFPPALTDDTLYYFQLGLNNQPSVTIRALNTSDGTLRWQWTTADLHVSTLNAMNLVSLNDTLYLTTNQGVYAFRGSDGHLLWHVLKGKDLSFTLPSAA